jgi:hypothetical protein
MAATDDLIQNMMVILLRARQQTFGVIRRSHFCSPVSRWMRNIVRQPPAAKHIGLCVRGRERRRHAVGDDLLLPRAGLCRWHDAPSEDWRFPFLKAKGSMAAKNEAAWRETDEASSQARSIKGLDHDRCVTLPGDKVTHARGRAPISVDALKLSRSADP